MKKTLIVIDMQNDFVTGALGSKEAVAILPNVKKKIDEYIAAGHEVIFTRDTHGENYMETREGKYLPVPHCIKGTDGWKLDAKIQREEIESKKAAEKNVLFPKKMPLVRCLILHRVIMLFMLIMVLAGI